MKRLVLIIFTLAYAYSLPLYSQTYSGQVFDSKSKQPLSYVNIGMPSKGVGTITDEEGKYTLILDNEFENDTLNFSLIGYKNVITSVHNYKANYSITNASFFLEETIYNLQEVVIKPKNIVTEITGNTISKVRPKDCRPLFHLFDSIITNLQNKEIAKAKYHKAFPEKHIELGSLFKIKKRETFIEKVQFHFCESKYDSLKLRLNIYSHLEDHWAVFRLFTKYDNVLKSPVYFTIHKNTPLTEIDLTSYNIKVTDDFIVTFETLGPEDYKKINIPMEKSLGGEPTVLNFTSKGDQFIQIPLSKLGCNVTVSYEKKVNWFTNLFN